ncbi:MAG: DUF523 domain-containing protein [Oscillospiraceae bacterium]
MTLCRCARSSWADCPTPRTPSERRGDRVVMNTGADVTEQYRRGAEAALRLCRLTGCEAAILKERSPSCGCGEIYDGSFTGTLTVGDGVTAELLRKNGVPVYGESRVDRAFGLRNEKADFWRKFTIFA